MAQSALHQFHSTAKQASRRWSARAKSSVTDFGWAAERCLRAAPHHLSCSHCIDACSEQALQFVDDGDLGLILQATDACHGCGACLPACPSEALLSQSLNSLEADIAKTQEQLGDKPDALALHCHRALPTANSTPLHCLRMLGPDLMYEWATLFGPEHVTLCVAEDCQSCPATPTEPPASRWWATAQTLGFLRHSGSAAFRAAPGAALSRRQLFSGAAQQPPTFSADSATVAARRLQRQHGANAQQQTPLPALQLDTTHCNSSHVCSQVCPTSALAITDQGNLYFNPLECLDCGHCTEHCPTQALRMSTVMESDAYELNQFDECRCLSCGHTFTLPRTSLTDSTDCPACQRDRALLQDDFNRLFF